MKLSSLLILAASTNADRSERRPRSPKLEGWMGKKNHVMTRSVKKNHLVIFYFMSELMTVNSEDFFS